MKQRLAAFIDQLILYDYLLFGGSVLLFILFLILAILMRRRTFLALLCTLLATATILLVPTFGYVKLHDYLYKHDLTVTEIRALEFTDALVVRGTLTNLSKRDFNYCTVTAGAYKITHNTLLDLLYPFNPFRSGAVTEQNIARGEQVNFKIFVEPFNYANDYNVSIGATCR